MFGSSRYGRDQAGHRSRGSALVWVLWIAVVGFLLSGALWTYLAAGHRYQSGREAALKHELALQECLELARRSPGLFDFSASATIEQSYRTVADGRTYRIRSRRWGFWAHLEIHEEGGQLLARRLVAGRAAADPGVVLAVRENQRPLVVADAARITGTVVVADRVVFEPWRGRNFSGPRPPFRRETAVLPRLDYAGPVLEELDRLLRDPAPAGGEAAIFQGPLVLDPATAGGADLIIVDGDLRLRGDWPRASLIVYATGSIEVEPGSRLMGQLLAGREVQIRGARIDWPGLVAVVSSRLGSERPRVTIAEGSIIEGTVCVGTGRDLLQPAYGEDLVGLGVDESSVLQGWAVVYGGLQMNGRLLGRAEVAETIERRSPATYHNWVLGGEWSARYAPDRPPLLPLGLAGDSVEILIARWRSRP